MERQKSHFEPPTSQSIDYSPGGTPTILVTYGMALLSIALISPEIPPIGSMVSEFERSDTRGQVRRLSDWRSSRLVVLAFVKVDCPVAELYAAELGRLSRAYEARGVSIVGVVPDALNTSTEIDRWADAHEIRFPILRDDGGRLADQVGATRTPEVVVLDDRRSIRYRGRIDDRYSVGSRKAEATTHELVDAIDRLLAGQTVDRAEAPAVGCRIARGNATSSAGGPTYRRDVAPILERRCVACHRPGQIGPFSLLNYRQAAAWADALAEAVEDSRMPPWHADPRYGHFSNEARLSDLEKKIIADWVEAGAVEGEGPEPPTRDASADGWRIARPDVVFGMSRAFPVPAEGVVDYQYFDVDPGFAVDTWIQAAEVRPGDRKVVHHCNVFLKPPGAGIDMETTGELSSYCLAAMTPGSPPMILPEGMAKRIPAGWHLLFVIHYSPTGTAASDRTSIGLVMADKAKVRKEVATNLLFDPALRIPAHETDHRVERSRRFDDDVLLLAMFPHMHLRGKSFRYEAIYPDGREEILLDVPRYDFRWQHRYELLEPKRLPAGTTLRCTAHFDNSASNPANPDPSAVVLAGTQSWDEMFNGYYDIAMADENLTRPATWRESITKPLRRSSRSLLQLAGISCLIPAWLLRRRISRRDGESRVMLPH